MANAELKQNRIMVLYLKLPYETPEVNAQMLRQLLKRMWRDLGIKTVTYEEIDERQLSFSFMDTPAEMNGKSPWAKPPYVTRGGVV